MATDEAIAAVGERLVSLLGARVADREGVDAEAVVLGSPADLADESGARLGLCLYSVAPARQHTEHDRTESNPPLALELRYLLTAYPEASGGRDGARDQHRLLGLAMQTFHDNAVLDPADLPACLGDRELQLSLETGGPDGQSWLWRSFPETPYRPSVSYHVRPVVIESRVEESVPEVTERRTELSRPR